MVGTTTQELRMSLISWYFYSDLPTGGDTEVSRAIGCLHRFLNDISGEER